MEIPWCENITVVQDSMALFPSGGFTALVIFGLTGLIMCYVSWRYLEPEYVLWLGIFIVFTSIWYFGEVNKERQKTVELFQSDNKIEFIGQVSGQYIEFVNGGKYHVDAPWGVFNNPFATRQNIWFKVDSTIIRSDVFRLNLKPGNKCNWWRCDLDRENRVRVTVDSKRQAKQAGRYGVENYYFDSLRIERCDD